MHRDEGGGCVTRQLDRGREDEEGAEVEVKEVEGAKKAEEGGGLAGLDAWPGAERQKGRGGVNHTGHE